MLGNRLSASACHSLLAWQASDLKFASPSSPPNKILLSNCRMVLPNRSFSSNQFCKRLGTRTKIFWSSLCSAPRLPSSSLPELYSQRQGPSRVVARATDEEGEGSERESGVETGGRKTLPGVVERLQSTLQIYVVAWVYIFYFFGASAWDGKGKKR